MLCVGMELQFSWATARPQQPTELAKLPCKVKQPLHKVRSNIQTNKNTEYSLQIIWDIFQNNDEETNTFIAKTLITEKVGNKTRVAKVIAHIFHTG